MKKQAITLQNRLIQENAYFQLCAISELFAQIEPEQSVQLTAAACAGIATIIESASLVLAEA